MLPRRWFPDHIDGDRVVLRRHVRENLGAFTRWYADPEIARLTRYQDGPMRVDEIERFFAMRAIGPDALAMAIHVRESERLIGSCAFSQLDGDNGSALFHITIGEHDVWGQGFGSEATSLMVDHAFAVLGLHRVALSVFAFNDRAIRAYERVGFVAEGRSRESIWRDGAWWDEIHMSVLLGEWQARQAGKPPPARSGSTTGPAGVPADPERAPGPVDRLLHAIGSLATIGTTRRGGG